ncbi:MAG TPA: hypothetical protein VGK16_05510 [Candidatus Limnocylindrales bacterium]
MRRRVDPLIRERVRTRATALAGALEGLSDYERMGLARVLASQPLATASDWRWLHHLSFEGASWRNDDPAEVAEGTHYAWAAAVPADRSDFQEFCFRHLPEDERSRGESAIIALESWGWMLGVAVARGDEVLFDRVVGIAGSPVLAAAPDPGGHP